MFEKQVRDSYCNWLTVRHRAYLFILKLLLRQVLPFPCCLLTLQRNFIFGKRFLFAWVWWFNCQRMTLNIEFCELVRDWLMGDAPRDTWLVSATFARAAWRAVNDLPGRLVATELDLVESSTSSSDSGSSDSMSMSSWATRATNK